MSKNEVRVGEAGTSIEMQIFRQDDTAYPVDDATDLQFIFQKPDGSIITRPADLVGSGTDGWVKYVTEEEDFDQVGTWLYQVYVEKIGVKHRTDYERLRIHPNLPLE